MLILQIALCMTPLVQALNIEPPTVPMIFTVLDETGQPIKGAVVHASAWSKPPFRNIDKRLATDGNGQASFNRYQPLESLQVWVGTVNRGHVGLFRGWQKGEHHEGKDIPKSFTFRMERAVSIGGRIVDRQGNGIAGARVEGRCQIDPKDVKLKHGIRYITLLGSGASAAITDPNGFWRFDTVPNVPAQFSLRFSHQDYISDGILRELQKEHGITSKQLYTGQAVIKLEKGAQLHGNVTDSNGKSIPHALIVFNDNPYGDEVEWEVYTDAKGHYELRTLPPGQHPITVVADGKMPFKQRLTLKPGQQEKNIQLKPGKHLRIQFVDSAGRPVKVYLSIDSWRDGRSLYTTRHSSVKPSGIPNQSDDHGLYEWHGAPDDEVTYLALQRGYKRTNFTLKADGTFHTITMKPIPQVHGSVIDATTGRPIETFKVIDIHELSPSRSYVNRRDGNQDEIEYLKVGRFTIKLERGDVDHSLMIEAPGYRTALSPPHLVAENISELTFPMVPAPPVTGRILNLDGKPAANVKIGLGTAVQDVTSRLEDDDLTVKTDAQGRFQFPAQSEPFMLFAETKQGFIEQRFEPDAKVGDLIVERGITVAGTLQHNGEPLRNNYVNVSPIHVEGENVKPNVEFRYSIATDAEGMFEVHIPSFDYAELRYGLPNETNGLRFGMASIPFSTMPGGVYRFDIGKPGAEVVGQLGLGQSQFKDLDFESTSLMLISRQPEVPYPPQWDGENYDIATNGQLALTSNRLHSLHRTIELQPLANGEFRIPNVPAGTYWLTIKVRHPEANSPDIATIATAVVPITISTKQANDKAKVELPKIVLKVLPASKP